MRRLVPGLVLLAAPALAQPAGPSRGAQLEEASRLIAEGRTIEAARQLRALAERFHSAEALLRLARLQSSQRDTQGAMESLREALLLAPNSEDLLSAYAQVSLGARLPLPAIVALEPLTRLCPSVAQYHYLLGVALMQAGDMAAAIDALQAAERLEPQRPLTLIALGLAHNNRKLYAEAKPYVLRGMALDPESPEAFAALAEAEAGLGELQAAESHARRALAKASENATASLVLGVLMMKHERYTEARAALEQAVAADPGSSRAHYQLSLACARLGDEAGARAQVELYQKTLREEEERVVQLRHQTGLSEGGMRP